MELETTSLELQRHPLVSLAEEINRFRLETASNSIYKDYKTEELTQLQRLVPQHTRNLNGLTGLLGEALFLKTMQYYNIPAQTSTGEEDWVGIDFFFGEEKYPLDVSVGEDRRKQKIKPERYTTLFLPRCKRTPPYSGYISRYLQERDFSPSEYMEDLIVLNFQILNQMVNDVELRNGKRDQETGLNNVTNLKTILDILAKTYY